MLKNNKSRVRARAWGSAFVSLFLQDDDKKRKKDPYELGTTLNY